MEHALQAPADDGRILSTQACMPEEGSQEALIQTHDDIFDALMPLFLISYC